MTHSKYVYCIRVFTFSHRSSAMYKYLIVWYFWTMYKTCQVE